MSSVLELRHLATLQAIDEAGSLVEAWSTGLGWR